MIKVNAAAGAAGGKTVREVLLSVNAEEREVLYEGLALAHGSEFADGLREQLRREIAAAVVGPSGAGEQTGIKPEPNLPSPAPAVASAPAFGSWGRDFSALNAKDRVERDRIAALIAEAKAAVAPAIPIAEPEPEPSVEPVALVQLPAVIVAPSEAGPNGDAGWTEPEVIEMNNKHAVISDLGGKCVIMEWKDSLINPGTKELNFQTFNSFRERYGASYIDIPNGPRSVKSEPLARYWLGHPKRRQYEGLALEPNGPMVLKGNLLNLWRGWGVEPRSGSTKLIRRHVEEVLANEDARFADFLYRSAAWKVQNPAELPRVATVLRGGKGTGKGVWGKLQLLIFGHHGLHIANSQHLTGKHNSHLQNKLFLFSDEATWAGDREAERTLKALITENVMMIEPKNINAFPWPNWMAVYMAANAKWVVPASHDERRFAVNNVSERWKQNPDYFRPLWEEINNGGAGALLYDLLGFNLDGWHPAENIPKTEALLQQKLHGLTGLEQWWAHMLSIGLHPKGGISKNPRRVKSAVLLKDAQAYTPRNRYITDEELASFLKDRGCVSKSDGVARGWVILPLDLARDNWLAHVGGAWDWDHALGDWNAKDE